MAANLAAGGQAGVGSGGLMLSPTDDPNLTSTGYVKSGITQLPDAWVQRTNGSNLAGRYGHTAMWTGTEMIVWGGFSGSRLFSDGAAFDPATDRWSKLPRSPLSPRIAPVGVWTGREMLVFGGSGSRASLSDGAAFDPTTGSWRRLAPIPSSLGGNLTGSGSYAVWTGTTMLAWGFFGNGEMGPFW